MVLHEALKRRSYWRPAIDALKASLALRDSANVRETYDKLAPSTDSASSTTRSTPTAAQPRLCIQFSERLARGQIDWSQVSSPSTARTRRP